MKIANDELAREEPSHPAPRPSVLFMESEPSRKPYRDALTEKGPTHLSIFPTENLPSTSNGRSLDDKSDFTATKMVNARLGPIAAELRKANDKNTVPTANSS